MQISEKEKMKIYIATKVDPKVEMERRKAVKKELEEMRGSSVAMILLRPYQAK